jgi:hypothetical protein
MPLGGSNASARAKSWEGEGEIGLTQTPTYARLRRRYWRDFPHVCPSNPG